MYIQSVSSIAIHPWWRLGKLYPHLTKFVSNVISTLMAGQPRSLQRNLNNKSCKMCSEGAKDTPEHVLMNCPSLSSNRAILLQHVVDEMPYAMKRDFAQFDSLKKNSSCFLASIAISM